MRNVYVCRPHQMSAGLWKPFTWLPSNDSLMKWDDEDVPPVLRDDFDSIITSLPAGIPAGFNLEPMSVTRHTAYKYLNYFNHPDEATAIFKSVCDRISLIRPDLDYCFYTLPQGAHYVTKDISYAVKVAERETAYAKATKDTLPTAAISGYWKDWKTPGTYEIWKRRMDYAIAMASTVHDKPLRAFVWDTGRGWKQPMPYEKFTKVLRYFARRDIDVVYWSFEYPVAWRTQLALWQYATGVL